MDALAGDHIFRVVCLEARHLTCSIPQTVTCYITLLTSFLMAHHFLLSIHNIYSKHQGHLTPNQAWRLDGLDTLRCQGMLYTEKHCWHLHMGSVDYSPIIALVHCRCWLWKWWMDRKLGHKVSRLFLKWLAHKCEVYDLFSISFDEAHHHYKQCDAKYAQLKHHALELQREFLLSLASNKASDMDTASQQAAQRTLCTERQCKEARHIKQVLGKASGGAIACIKVTTADGLIEVDLQADVEHHTMDMCLAQFRLMESMPPILFAVN